MAKVINVPALGIAIANVTINTWFIREGEQVTQGKPLLEVQTDKITMEIPAETSGILLKALHPEGAALEVGAPLAIIGEPGEQISHLVSQYLGSATASAAPEGGEKVLAEAEAQGDRSSSALPLLASPLAKRIAREKGVDLSKVKPSSPRGRITEKDVQRYLEQTASSAEGIMPPAIPQPSPEESDGDEAIPLKGTRKVIADNVAQSARLAPQYTMFIEIDCSQLVALRDQLREEFREQAGVDLTFIPFIVKAIAQAVSHVKIVNASLQDDVILIHKQVNVGVAVASGDFIYVPVIKQPLAKSLPQIAREFDEYVKLARDNALKIEHITAGTLTITNMGVTDIVAGTSIIHQPQVGIVAIGKITDRVVPDGGEFVVKPIMIASFTYDHRVVMGVPGGRFAEWVKYYLENPEFLLTS